MDTQEIAFYRSVAGVQNVADEGFLAAVAWKQSAPAALTSVARRGDVDAFCRQLRDADRLPPLRRQSKAAAGRRFIQRLLWSQFAFDATERQNELIALFDELVTTGDRALAGQPAGRQKKKKNGKPLALNGRKPKAERPVWQKLAAWLNGVTIAAPLMPFELLGLLDLLATASRMMPESVLWKLWRTALVATIDLSGELADPQDAGATEDQRLLVLGELPWLAGLVFADVRGAGKLHQQGRTYLNRQLLDWTDSDGTPHAGLIRRLPLWLAPLVRAAERSDGEAVRLWNGQEQQQRYADLMKAVVPLCRPDGRLALGNGAAHDPASLLQAALVSTDCEKKSPWMKYLSAVEKLSANGKAARKRGDGAASKPVKIKLDGPPAGQSDWAQLACFRNDLTTAADSLVVAHHGELPFIELVAHGTPLLAGRWDIAVKIDGEPLPLEADWTCVCWHSDEDADYLELQMQFPDAIRIERQLVLSRGNRWAIFADSISGADGRRIEYTSRLPLVDGVEGHSQAGSRECVLKSSRQLARVFPLALPQDRVLSTAGGFGPLGRDLVLKQVAQGNGLYAPLVIDWKRKRRRTPADWRTLTVTEDGRILPGGEAAGHRLRIGDHHLIVYRSLVKSGHPRAVLGHQTYHESVIGRFESIGRVTPIVMVDG